MIFAKVHKALVSHCYHERRCGLDATFAAGTKPVGRKLAGLSEPRARELLVELWAERFILEFFADASYGRWQKRGNHNQMHVHLFEVHTILVQAGAPLTVRLAGLLHDIHEHYTDVPEMEAAELLRRKLRKYARELNARLSEQEPMHGCQDLEVEAFVEEVRLLVEAVTEPHKSSAKGDWLFRKETYLRQVKAGIPTVENGRFKVAVLSCATKLSGLLAAIDIHAEGLDTSAWSAGSLQDNVQFFTKLDAFYEEAGVPTHLLAAFRHCLEVFKLGPRRLP